MKCGDWSSSSLRNWAQRCPPFFDLEETILIDDGKYTARSYRVEGYMAMWLLEVGIVQFYDAEGNMLATVNLLKELEPLKIAA